MPVFSRIIFLVMLIAPLSARSQTNGHKIEVNIADLADTTVMLAHYVGNTMMAEDTILINKFGYGAFKGNNTLNQGLYAVFFPNGNRAEFIVGSDQFFKLNTNAANAFDKTFEGSEENSIFNNFNRYMSVTGQNLRSLNQQLNNFETESEQAPIREEISQINTSRWNKVNEVIDNNPELFVSTFLKASIDIYPPEELNQNPVASYLYMRDHYFDNFDLSDKRLFFTPFYEKKLLQYIDEIFMQIPDSIIKAADKAINKVINDSVLYRHVTFTLFNKYANSETMGMDAVFAHIGKKYYTTNNWWDTPQVISNIKKHITALEYLLIGKKAPNARLIKISTDHFKQSAYNAVLKQNIKAGNYINIHEIDAKYTILFFWDPTCDHCKAELPVLYSNYQETLNAMGVKVVAISTLAGSDGKEKWIDYINTKQMYNWINAWNPDDYQYKTAYNIRTIPEIYILNKEKTIIGKNVDAKDVGNLIQEYESLIE